MNKRLANRLGRQSRQSEITTQGKADREPTALKLWGSPEAGGAEHEGSRAKANHDLKKGQMLATRTQCGESMGSKYDHFHPSLVRC